MINALQEKMW